MIKNCQTLESAVLKWGAIEIPQISEKIVFMTWYNLDAFFSLRSASFLRDKSEFFALMHLSIMSHLLKINDSV